MQPYELTVGRELYDEKGALARAYGTGRMPPRLGTAPGFEFHDRGAMACMGFIVVAVKTWVFVQIQSFGSRVSRSGRSGSAALACKFCLGLRAISSFCASGVNVSS